LDWVGIGGGWGSPRRTERDAEEKYEVQRTRYEALGRGRWKGRRGRKRRESIAVGTGANWWSAKLSYWLRPLSGRGCRAIVIPRQRAVVIFYSSAIQSRIATFV